MTSPPDLVIRARKVWGLIDDLRNRTEPSLNRALKPPGCREPSPRRGFDRGARALPNGRSSGLVQGTAWADSTTITVFGSPSVTAASRVGRAGSRRAPGPEKTR